MAYPTTTELPAVNQILQSCGQAPVTTLDQTNPDVAIAFETLKEVSREVQAEGWSFNKEFHYKMAVTLNTTTNQNEVIISDSFLQVDLSNPADGDTVRRNGKLYNRATHSFEFKTAPECDVVWFFEWKDLPVPVQDFITARAASIVSSRIVGDPNQYQMLQQKEAYCRAMAMEYECNQGDYTFFGHSNTTNQYNSYKPYHALYR